MEAEVVKEVETYARTQSAEMVNTHFGTKELKIFLEAKNVIKSPEPEKTLPRDTNKSSKTNTAEPEAFSQRNVPVSFQGKGSSNVAMFTTSLR